MIQTIYISTPTRPMSTDDLMEILDTSRQNNLSLGVSGMLLYTGTVFIQILEGDEKVVDDLITTIRKDSRHTDFRIIEKKNHYTRVCRLDHGLQAGGQGRIARYPRFKQVF